MCLLDAESLMSSSLVCGYVLHPCRSEGSDDGMKKKRREKEKLEIPEQGVERRSISVKVNRCV